MALIDFHRLRTEKLGNRSRNSVYRDLEAGRLPRPVKIGARLYWIEEEVDAAIAALPR